MYGGSRSYRAAYIFISVMQSECISLGHPGSCPGSYQAVVRAGQLSVKVDYTCNRQRSPDCHDLGTAPYHRQWWGKGDGLSPLLSDLSSWNTVWSGQRAGVCPAGTLCGPVR